MKLEQAINNRRVYIIAEMSANHGGSLDRALEIVDAAARAGADCLKIQTYTADTMTLDCDKEYFQLTSGLWKGYTRYQLYQDANTPWEWHGAIADRCRERGIDFLSTPFDFTSADFLRGMDVEAYKIASFELTDLPLIRHVAAFGRPMIVSCGMGTKDEIGEAVHTIREVNDSLLVLLKCTSEYPAVYEDMNLSLIPRMSEDFGTPAGLSDHSMGYEVAVAAAALGASVIEKHFCLSREFHTPDSAFSMEPEEFAAMVRAVRNVEAARGTGEYTLTQREMDKRINRRSLFIGKDIKAGEKLTEENIAIIRPAHGLHPRYYGEVLGKTAVRDLAFGDPLREGDYE
ncbi:MAG: pseudaminic acid synthase [Lachnospiraceae bacterium]|nr:pseudaminic acid synthase [Lachnospiraceae bacterium]